MLQLGLVLLRKVAEEVFQKLALFVGKETEVVQLMDVAQVGKYTVGVCQVLVDIVEIADEQLSPAVELVERLVGTRLLTKRLVEVANQLDGVGYLPITLLTKEFADGDIGRTPQRALGDAGQLFVEEQRGSFVRKYNSRTREVGAVFPDNILGDVS